MAAPITHIVLSMSIFDKHFSHFDLNNFLIGTSFPDIRHVAKINRNKTHFSNITLSNIANLNKKNSFKAGYLFHSYVDQWRENLVRNQKIFDFAPNTPYISTSLKFFEDIILYPKISNWKKFSKYFDQILNEEITFDPNINIDVIQKWHKKLVKYFSCPPSENQISNFITKSETKPLIDQEINKNIEIIKKRKIIINYARNLDKIFRYNSNII